MTRTGADASPVGVPAPGFSVHAYARSARGSHRAGLNLAGYGSAPLPVSVLDQVDTLAGLERSALGYLRSVLVTPTHADAEVTAFLVTWAYEKYWLADALEAIVAAHPGYPSRAAADGLAERVRRGVHDLGERLEPIADASVRWDKERALQLFEYIKTDETDKITKAVCTKDGLPAR